MKQILTTAVLALAVVAGAQSFKPIEPTQTARSVCPTNCWVVTTNTCQAMGIQAFNRGATDVYLSVFDARTAPTNGATIMLPPVPVYADMGGGIDWTWGRRFTNGLTIGFSTSSVLFTNAGTNVIVDVNYYGKPN